MEAKLHTYISSTLCRINQSTSCFGWYSPGISCLASLVGFWGGAHTAVTRRTALAGNRTRDVADKRCPVVRRGRPRSAGNHAVTMCARTVSVEMSPTVTCHDSDANGHSEGALQSFTSWTSELLPVAPVQEAALR
jgi:hypothetical protein